MSDVDDLTDDELLEIVSKDGKASRNLKDDESNVKDFIRDYGIKDGDFLVPNYLVYFFYRRKWKPAGFKLSKIEFLRKFNIPFDPKRRNHTRYYLLNQEAFEISGEILDEAKEFDKRYRIKITKKHKQKTK